jgi:hypothetical protein
MAFVQPVRGLRAFILIASLAATTAACITFEEQTMSYHHDVAGDRLLIYTTYSGIYGDERFGASAEDPGTLTPDEEEDLLSVVAGRRIYFFDSWTRVIDLDELGRQLSAPAKVPVSTLDRAANEAKRTLWATLVANVTISNGPLYLDRRGRLAGVQRVTIVNLRATITTINRALHAYALSLAMEDPEWSERASTIGQWLAFDGNEFTLRYPRDGETGNPFSLPGLAPPDQPIITRIYGTPDGTRVTVTAPVAGRYIPNAVTFIEKRVGLESQFDPEIDAAMFFAGKCRDCSGRR